jgi:hypothetical protein
MFGAHLSHALRVQSSLVDGYPVGASIDLMFAQRFKKKITRFHEKEKITLTFV